MDALASNLLLGQLVQGLNETCVLLAGWPSRSLAILAVLCQRVRINGYNLIQYKVSGLRRSWCVNFELSLLLCSASTRVNESDALRARS